MMLMQSSYPNILLIVMFSHYSKDIGNVNSSLQKTRKLFVATGCSFTYGTAAFDLDLIDKYQPKYKNGAYWSLEHLTENQKLQLIKDFPNVQMLENGDLNFGVMEVNNSYLTRLYEKYYKDTHTILNLGVSSSSIFASVMRLFTAPVQWDLADEIILIFSPTSGNRLGILNDDYIFGNEYHTLWPWSTGITNRYIDDMQEGFGHSFYSPKWDILNILTSVKLLTNWVTFNRAKLITFPAFNRDFTPENFKTLINTKVIRSVKDRTILEIKENTYTTNEELFLYETFPWHSFIAPQGHSNFFDLAYSQEPDYDPKHNTVSMAHENGGSTNKWIMNCGHPDAKAHDLLADEIHKHLIATDNCSQPWNIWN